MRPWTQGFLGPAVVFGTSSRTFELRLQDRDKFDTLLASKCFAFQRKSVHESLAAFEFGGSASNLAKLSTYSTLRITSPLLI